MYMSKLVSILLIFVSILSIAACGDKDEDTASANFECPAAEDDCMTEELYQECLSLVETCTGNILIAESCPVQFSCEE